MKTFLSHLRDIAVSGFFALLPLYVLFIVIAKVWKSLSSVGAGIAGMFGMKAMLGGGSTVVSGLLLITICACAAGASIRSTSAYLIWGAALWLIVGLGVAFSIGNRRFLQSHPDAAPDKPQSLTKSGVKTDRDPRPDPERGSECNRDVSPTTLCKVPSGLRSRIEID